jgi:hypothetical protein
VNRARRRALALAFILASGVAALSLATIRTPHQGRASAPAPVQRPKLLLLTSLPLLFNEQFGLSGSGSPALKALQSRYEVVPISVADGAELARGRLLLLAQPRAQTAENLVVLDAWVRKGGHLLLLADPLLEWPSKLPLGDVTRPPAMFADTGLLAHWQLTLDAPDRRGPATRKLAGKNIVTVSPGSLRGGCSVSPDRFVAACRIGAGRVIVNADADFLNVDPLGAAAHDNLEALRAELALLDRP